MQITQKTTHLLTTSFSAFPRLLFLISQVVLEKFTKQCLARHQHIIGTDELAVRFRAAFLLNEFNWIDRRLKKITTNSSLLFHRLQLK